MRTQSVRADDVVLTVLCTATGPALWWAGTAWSQTAGAVGGPQQMERWLATGCAVIGAAIALWWVVVLLATGIAIVGAALRMPRLAHWGRSCSPVFLRRTLAAALGLQLLAAPGAWAAPATAPDARATGTGLSASLWPTPTGGGQGQRQSADDGRNGGFLGAATAPSPAAMASARVHDGPFPSPGWRPDSPTPAPPGADRRTGGEQPSVTVRAGDCLWDIAAEELGPHATDLEVDRRWRQWHHANRALVGEDPHLLRPGTVLTAPAWT